MRALILRFSLALAVGSVAPALLHVGLGSAASAAEPVSADAALRQSSADEVHDFMVADTNGLNRLWADTFVVTNPLNQFVSKAQVLAMVDSGKLRFASYERSIEYVHAYGDIAIVAGAEKVLWAGSMPLAGKVSHLRFTAVWRRTGSAWQEIARHANIVPDR